jgi:protein TonB
MLCRQLAIGIFFAALIAACSKTEPPASPKASAPITPATVPAPDPNRPVDIDPALKERLARQEAAAQMFERKAPEPSPPKAADHKPAESPKTAPPPAPEPAKPAPPAESPRVIAAAAPARPAPAPEKSAAPAPAKAEAPAPRTDIAAAKPSAAAAPAPARLITRVDPEFPREAVQAGVEKGSVRARMTLDDQGAVSRVEVVDATPHRVFDRAVIRALSQWKFNEGTAGRTVEMEVEFKR